MEENHSDGRTYKWREEGYLRDLSEVDDLKPPERLNEKPKLINTLSCLKMTNLSRSDFIK